MKPLFRGLTKNSDVVIVVLVLGVLVVLFTPIPSALLDFLILTNFSFALLILLLTVDFHAIRTHQFHLDLTHPVA